MRYLYLIKPIDSKAGPWNPWYDKCFGAVVCAQNENAARFELAREREARAVPGSESPEVWLDVALTTCAQLGAAEPDEDPWGPADVVLLDVRMA